MSMLQDETEFFGNQNSEHLQSLKYYDLLLGLESMKVFHEL